jgi:hypothetical protein
MRRLLFGSAAMIAPQRRDGKRLGATVKPQKKQRKSR